MPQSTAARMRFLLKGAKSSTKQLAQELGVSQRTVQRWLKGQGNPKPAATSRRSSPNWRRSDAAPAAGSCGKRTARPAAGRCARSSDGAPAATTPTTTPRPRTPSCCSP
ncbi:helix-turn-helix domain-containing protein [Kitasatospora sp. NPDC015120]|uniref:helix-turn-helix domain-containing protein n=1 Tax=Kitasatospora sp. NPDC015120 TaxID=3364023 RepID=UPI0036F47843